jgi:hypothetical protein
VSKLFLKWYLQIFEFSFEKSRKWGNACTIQKSDNLQYDTLGLWAKQLIDQASDVPIIIYFS